ncbi:hypothetical protein PFTANZ_04144 [Plasmodium falciparum Tanzania (2000708)]|uniref:Leucine-rich repeat protein n=1 Tax=Plasmodium falciparum Tanzania (2000708) TaxID=1036725 RepID=A0A024W4S2_PLAFA|nr:hypothetical protein PFTANZ_04144 [Plasmodium falciparum Tanzania (2000708)]
MNIKSKFQKLKLENDVIYSSNLIINEDDIADFVSTLNIQKKNINDENCSTHNLSTVKVIHLSSLKINDWGLSILIPCILRSRKLTTLNLSNNCLTNDSANILSKCLKYLPHLRCLNLSNNLIKCQGAINIIEEFFQDNIKENSTSLNIYHVDNLEENILTNNNKINQNKYLQEIDISDNFLGTNFIIKLSDILHKKKDKKKYKIVLKNVGINNTDICYFLPKCKDVEILNISENKIMFENFPKYIEILFDVQPNLKQLYLASICGDHPDEDISNINIFKDIIINRHNEENNFFSCIGISNFYRATDLSKNLYLQETRRNCIYKINEEFNKLYNSNNIFSANCLKGLKFLNLSSCNINNDGISYLLKSLKTSLCTLEYLDISCCQDLSNNTYQEFTNLISYKKYKFLKTNHFVFKNLPLTVRGIPPMLIPLYDSEDNTDGNSTESDWWNYKKED